MADVRIRSFLSRPWLLAPAFVAATVFLLGKCKRGEVIEPPPGTTQREAKSQELAGRDEISGWARRFAIQQAPPAVLRADPEESSGVLANGFRYILRENAAEAGEVSLRLLVLVGSMHEEVSEAGFAHFIEHLAFQLPGDDDAIQTFERLGLAAGADTNARTSADHTLYRLDLPVGDDESLETALTFLRRVAGELDFEVKAVEAERRVILREIEEMPASTDFFRKSAALLPGVRATRHQPAGYAESVQAATPAVLRGFWERHFVPSRMVLVVAGDLKAEPMAVRIRRHFDSLPAKPAPPEPEPGDPLAAPEVALQCLAEEGKDQLTITLAVPQEFAVVPFDLEARRRAMVRFVALTMLETRIARTFEGREVPGTPPSAKESDLIPGIRWLELSTVSAPHDAPRVLGSLLSDWRQALGYEFHSREFAEARGKARHAVRQHFVSRLGRMTAALATGTADAARNHGVVESPEDELNRYISHLATMTRQECEALLRAEWGKTPPRILLTGAVKENTEKLAREEMERAMKAPLTPHGISEETETWAPDPIGPAGRIVRRHLDADRGYLEAEFSNRVLVRLAPMPSLGGAVEVRVHIGHGLLSAPIERPGIVTAAETLVRWHPLENWSQLKLDASLADEDVSRRFSAEADRFEWSGSTDRSQLKRQLDLLAALLHRPGVATIPPWRPGPHVAAWEAKRRRILESDFGESIRLRSGRDPRFDPVPDGLMRSDSRQVADWLLPMLATERLAVFIAGDFEPLAALDAVAATFGALPERVAWQEPPGFPPPPLPEPGMLEVEKGTLDTSASVTLHFPLSPRTDAADELRRDLLTQLVQLRLRAVMRESRGKSYAPCTTRSAVMTGGNEWLSTRVPCPAGRVDETSVALRELILNFREQGWRRDEFRRAVRPLAHQIRHQRRDPDMVLTSLMAPHQIPMDLMLDASFLNELEGSMRQLASQALDFEAAVELQVHVAK